MDSTVECVPNVSEGTGIAVLDALEVAISHHPRAFLLDRTSDSDHGRSVFTAAGGSDSMVDSMESLVETAVELIDMRAQRGAHPRVGAVDVVPFVPLGGVDMATCTSLAHSLGERVVDRFGLPVYFYGAATKSARSLADIRRPGFEGLAVAMRMNAGKPDIGPPRPHPTAGAVCIGARRFLVAFNIQLDTEDVSAARRMAARIRERDGGLAGLQALGIDLASENHAQLSMNILDHVRTPLWQVWEETRRLAKAEGVRVCDSELIGLVPRMAMLEVADHIGATSTDEASRIEEAGASLRIREFTHQRVLEYRLAQAEATAGST